MENVKPIDHNLGPDPYEASPWRVAEAHVNLGAELLQAHELAKAERHLRRAIELRREADWRPGNSIAQNHLAGLAHFNLGLVYTERANSLTNHSAKQEEYECAIEEFVQAIGIGERAPNFQKFTFDSHRWIATLRHDFGVKRELESLSLKGPDSSFQDCLFQLVKADTDVRQWRQSHDETHLENARTGYVNVIENITRLKNQGRNHPDFERLLNYCNVKRHELNTISW
jgi:tetratricopeptide (TPR) repeat protein